MRRTVCRNAESERALEHGLGHLFEQTALAQLLHALFARLLNQRLCLLGIEELMLLRIASRSRTSTVSSTSLTATPPLRTAPAIQVGGHALTQTV